jgi:putative transposase
VLDCIHSKVRDSGVVKAKAIYLASGINMAGKKEELGLWVAQNGGARSMLPNFLQIAISLAHFSASLSRNANYEYVNLLFHSTSVSHQVKNYDESLE